MEQQELFTRTVEILQITGIPYMVTGSFAVNFYGLPRTTHDLDFLVQIRTEDVPRLVQAFPSDFYADARMIRDAIEHQNVFNIIDPTSGLKIDFWILKQDSFDSERFKRRRPHTLLGHTVWMPTPEDVILAKLLWYRQAGTDKHLHDARGVWDVQGESLDRGYLERWAVELSIVDLLERVAIHDE